MTEPICNCKAEHWQLHAKDCPRTRAPKVIENTLLDDALEICRELTTGPFEEGAQACFKAISELKSAREAIAQRTKMKSPTPSPISDQAAGERTPYYLIESPGRIGTFWCGPSWVDFTGDPRKAVRFPDRLAAENFRYEWLTASKVTEHLDIVADNRFNGLSRKQCNSIQYFVDQMRGVSAEIYIDMLDGFRDYINSLVIDSRSTAATTGSIPADVLAALDRMCSPVHESRLSGVTAQEDARCMQIIREYVVSSPFTDRIQYLEDRLAETGIRVFSLEEQLERANANPTAPTTGSAPDAEYLAFAEFLESVGKSDIDAAKEIDTESYEPDDPTDIAMGLEFTGENYLKAAKIIRALLATSMDGDKA